MDTAVQRFKSHDHEKNWIKKKKIWEQTLKDSWEVNAAHITVITHALNRKRVRLGSGQVSAVNLNKKVKISVKARNTQFETFFQYSMTVELGLSSLSICRAAYREDKFELHQWLIREKDLKRGSFVFWWIWIFWIYPPTEPNETLSYVSTIQSIDKSKQTVTRYYKNKGTKEMGQQQGTQTW